MKSECCLVDSWLHWIMYPCVKKIFDWNGNLCCKALHTDPVLKGCSGVLYFSWQSAHSVCVCVHGHTCCSFTLCVGDSACKAGCQHLCIAGEVKGEVWLPKYWHLVLSQTFFVTLLLHYLLFWYFTWSPPSCLPTIHFCCIVKMPLGLYFKEANWTPKSGYSPWSWIPSLPINHDGFQPHIHITFQVEDSDSP